MSAEDAWTELEKANKERDLDDFRIVGPSEYLLFVFR